MTRSGRTRHDALRREKQRGHRPYAARDPRILILDDSTSSVDTETEAAIRQALETLMENRTTFIIAHRIQSVMNADLILVMNKRVSSKQENTTTSLIKTACIAASSAQTRIEDELQKELESAFDHYEFEEEEFTTQFNGQTIRRIPAQAMPHWPYLVGFLIFIALTAVLDALFTYLSKQIIDVAIVPRDRDALTRIITIYGSLIAVQAGFVFGFIYLTGLLGEKIRYDLRKKLFNHLQRLSLSYYSKTPVGWIMSRVTSDTERVAELVTWGLVDTAWGVLNISTSLVFMAFIDWRLALIVSVTIPVIIVVAFYFKKRIIVEYRQVRKVNSKITGAYNETITGVRVVKALGREHENLEEFKGLTSEMYRAGYRAAWLSALFLPAVQIISALSVGVILWYSGRQVANVSIGGATISIGGIQAFITYVTFMLFPIQEMARVYAEMQQAIASAERIFSLLDAEAGDRRPARRRRPRLLARDHRVR